MVHVLANRTNIMAIQNHLTLEFVPVLLDVVVLDHNDHHINLREELVEVEDLVLDNRLLSEEGVEGLERPGKVALLDVEHLEGRALADVIDVLLVGEAVETDAAVVGDAVLLHNLVDALEDEDGLVVVGLHRLVDDLGELGIVAHEEPGIDADAVAAYAGARLKDIHAGVHIADADDLIDVHLLMAANARKLIGKGDVDRAERVLDDLCHLSRADVRHHDLALAEALVIRFYALPDLTAVSADGTVVMQQLIDHIAWNNALRRMDKMNVLPYNEAPFRDHRAHIAVDGPGGNR